MISTSSTSRIRRGLLCQKVSVAQYHQHALDTSLLFMGTVSSFLVAMMVLLGSMTCTISTLFEGHGVPPKSRASYRPGAVVHHGPLTTALSISLVAMTGFIE